MIIKEAIPANKKVCAYRTLELGHFEDVGTDMLALLWLRACPRIYFFWKREEDLQTGGQ